MAEYTVLPLDPNNVDWLQSEDFVVPDVAGPSRFPTLTELKHALSLLTNFRVQMEPPNSEESWNVVIDRPDQTRGDLQTVLSITAYQGDDVPHGFWFEEGWPPVVVGLLQSLAAFTGPLVVLATCNGAPAIIEATSDIQAVLRTWRHTAGRYG